MEAIAILFKRFQNKLDETTATKQFEYYDECDYDDYLRISNNELDGDDDSNRFMPIHDRRDTSSLPLQTICDIQVAKGHNFFKTAPLLKDPFDETILRQLIFDIKPKTVFEFGTFTGSSASYIAMLLKEYDLDTTKIITFDKYEEYRHKTIDNDEFIEYIICDLNQDWNDIEALNKDKLSNKYKHPWLVIEDSHCDIVNMLDYLDENGMQKGDYLIIEDTTPGLPGHDKKLNHLRQWMNNNEGKGYVVDAKYCDFWGYNATWNANGYITKIK
eukprot:178796_1